MEENNCIDNFCVGMFFTLLPKRYYGTKNINKYGSIYKIIDLNKNSRCVLFESLPNNRFPKRRFVRWVNVEGDEHFKIGDNINNI